MHPEDLPDLLAAQDAALTAGEAFEVVHRILAADGEYRWMPRAAPPASAPDGAPNGYVGACVDIERASGRWATSCASRRRSSTTIVQCAPIGFALLDLEMRYVRVNEALAEMQRDRAGGPHRPPPDRDPARRARGDHRWRRAVQRVLETGEQIADVEISGETPAGPVPRATGW